MQCYIVHKDPKQSAKLLPTYALRVNMREGWAILSDIGHRFGVTFDHQTKAYNPWTRTFSHKQGIGRLIVGIAMCCAEYVKRTGKYPCWCEWISNFETKVEELLRALPVDQEAKTLHYLVTAKADKMTEAELTTLKGESSCTSQK